VVGGGGGGVKLTTHPIVELRVKNEDGLDFHSPVRLHAVQR